MEITLVDRNEMDSQWKIGTIKITNGHFGCGGAIQINAYDNDKRIGQIFIAPGYEKQMIAMIEELVRDRTK